MTRLLVLITLLFCHYCWGFEDKHDDKRATDYIPPGMVTLQMSSDNNIWSAVVAIGSTGLNLTYLFDSQLGDIVVNDTSIVGTSLSFVPIGADGNLTIRQKNTLVSRNITGPLAYETFDFQGISIYGREFLLNATLDQPRMGFSFLQPGNSIASSLLVDSFYQQGLIAHRLIGFVSNLVNTSNVGRIIIGDFDSTAPVGGFTNYSVNINNGQWVFSLNNMQFGTTGLGYNGFVTVATASPISIVPIPVVYTLVNLIGIPPLYIIDDGETVTATYFILDINFNALPPITLFLNDVPLSISPRNYIRCRASMDGQCDLTFVGANNVSPYRAAFTLGTIALDSNYVVFNFEQDQMQIAPLNP